MASASKGYKIGILVGSLRKESFSRKLAQNLTTIAPKQLSFEFVEIGNLPFYNEDLETENPPKPWVDFRKHVSSVDGLLFVTPEYNRSVPAVLKNALDVGSRPYGKSVWTGKPGAVVSSSPGAIGGFGANQHLRQSFVFLDIPTLQSPEVYVSGVNNLLDSNGRLSNPKTEEFLKGFMNTYAEWVERILRK